MDQFLACLPFILKEEGGNDDDPHDPGGRTSRGITQREYDAYRRSKGEPTHDVWKATDDEVKEIYQLQYWEPWCTKMPHGVDLAYFDMAVNAGPHESTLLIQRAAGVIADGHIGLVTLDALQSANPIRLISAFSDNRRAYYRSLKGFKYYGKGWLARTGRIETAALLMAAQKVA